MKFTLVLGCAKKTPQMAPEEVHGVLEQVCDVERSRHKKTENNQLVFIGNSFVESYGRVLPDPKTLWESVNIEWKMENGYE